MQVEGFGDGEFAAVLLAEFETMRMNGRAQLFFEMSGMPGYDSELRVALTNRFLTLRDEMDFINTFTLSKLVAMGVTVASLALGNLIRVSRTRVDFETAVDAALRNSGSRATAGEILFPEKTRSKVTA
jgi:hypothetical protein